MSQFLLVLAVALTVGLIVFGIIVLFTGDEAGLRPVEPDEAAVPLPSERPLAEPDVAATTFDVALRGYRMAQVDAAMRRVAYDIGYKEELIQVLQAEVEALREDRYPDAEVLRRAREASAASASGPSATGAATAVTTTPPVPREPETQDSPDPEPDPDQDQDPEAGSAPEAEPEPDAEPGNAEPEPVEEPASGR